MSELGHEHHGWARTFDETVDKTGKVEKNLTVSVMPEIIKMRKEWKKKYGDTRMFDHFYMGLRDRVGKSWLRSMKEAQALGAKFAYHPDKTKKVQIGSRVMDVYVNEWEEIEKDIEKAEKDTWLYIEEKEQ